jgi:hypothetical protein
MLLVTSCACSLPPITYEVGAGPDFPMSIVCSEQLADRCSIDEVAVAVTKPSVQAITTGEAQHRQVLDSSALDIEKVADLLQQASLLDADRESS